MKAKRCAVCLLTGSIRDVVGTQLGAGVSLTEIVRQLSDLGHEHITRAMLQNHKGHYQARQPQPTETASPDASQDKKEQIQQLSDPSLSSAQALRLTIQAQLELCDKLRAINSPTNLRTSRLLSEALERAYRALSEVSYGSN
jgi:hypothetical protein